MTSIVTLEELHGSIQHIKGSDLQHYRRAVADLTGRQSTQFPGGQPVTFTRSDLNTKLHSEFLVCEKTDGVRHLLYLGMDQNRHGPPERRQFLIDRKNQYYNILEDFSIALDVEIEQQSEHGLYRGTLLDGELVQQKTSGEQLKLLFLIFDCLALSGINMMDRDYDTRVRFLEAHFRSNCVTMCPSSLSVSARSQPWFSFCLLLKSFRPVKTLETLLQVDTGSLPFASDGLIFASKSTPYICGTNQKILKWKRPEDLTVDFLVRPWLIEVERVVRKRREGVEGVKKLYLFINSGDSGHHYFAPLFVTISQYEHFTREMQISNSTILECFNDKQTGLWRPKLRPDGTLLFRRDKTRANHIRVVQDILEALRDTVTEQDLIDFVLQEGNTSHREKG